MRSGNLNPLTEKEFKELVYFAYQMASTEDGRRKLLNWNPRPIACACYGSPYVDGELCQCALNQLLIGHLVEVVNKFHPELAQVIMRRRIIQALSGRDVLEGTGLGA